MSSRPPVFALLFFALFGFIGIAVLVSIWTTRGFGEPPLIFKLVGSCIALAFILMGFGTPLAALKKSAQQRPQDEGSAPGRPPNKTPGTYDCPHCGANIKDGEVSPSGDLKCTYCKEWWNIHHS